MRISKQIRVIDMESAWEEEAKIFQLGRLGFPHEDALFAVRECGPREDVALHKLLRRMFDDAGLVSGTVGSSAAEIDAT